MGTLLQARLLCADDSLCEKAFSAASGIVNDLDGELSVYHESEITRINRDAGTRLTAVSPDTYTVIAAALDIARKSEGYFDPTIAPLLEAYSLYTRFDGREMQPVTAEQIAVAALLVNYRDLRMTQGRQIGLARKGMKLDLGGIGKGYALDKIAAAFMRLGIGAFALNFGGHLLVHNLDHTSEILQPESGERLLTCRLSNGSLSASAQNQRYVRMGDKRIGHIANPREPYATAEPGRISVVYHTSAMQADGWSTALFFPGANQFQRWSETNRIAAWRFGADGYLASAAATRDGVCVRPNR